MSLKEAIALSGDKNIYIAGGYELYKEALPSADKLYITEVDFAVTDGDLFFSSLTKMILKKKKVKPKATK